MSVRKEVETIYDPEHKRRVIIFERADGTFGFLEEHFSEEPFEHCWIPVFRQTESFCDSLDTVVREVYGRVTWLSRAVQP